jgi:hypothetical protein
MAANTKKLPMNVKKMATADVARGRPGKHRQAVMKILSDLDQVGDGVAL